MTEYQLLIIEGMMKLENHEKILKLGGEIWMSLCKYLFLRILPKNYILITKGYIITFREKYGEYCFNQIFKANITIHEFGLF